MDDQHPDKQSRQVLAMPLFIACMGISMALAAVLVVAGTLLMLDPLRRLFMELEIELPVLSEFFMAGSAGLWWLALVTGLAVWPVLVLLLGGASSRSVAGVMLLNGLVALLLAAVTFIGVVLPLIEVTNQLT